MNGKQTNAILTYLEFQLEQFVERLEQHIYDPDVIGDMYDGAYQIIRDMENTLSTQELLDAPNPLTSD